MVTLAVLFLGVCLIFLTAFQGTETCAEVSLKDKQGVVSSPNFPQSYFPNTCTIWTLQRSKSYTSSYVVTISVQYLDLPPVETDGQCHNNYIRLGLTGQMTRICGQQTQSYMTPPSGREFSIEFTSGPIPLGHGFQLEYFIGPQHAASCEFNQFHCQSGKCIPSHWKCNGQNDCEHGEDEHFCRVIHRPLSLPPLTQMPRTTMIPLLQHPNTTQYSATKPPTCSHVLHNRTGQFQLLVSPSNMHQTCSWLIDVPGNVDKIILRFLRLDIYSDAYIWVYKGEQANISNCLGQFNGRSKIQIVTAHSNSLFVEFRLAFDNPASLWRDLFFVAKYTAISSEYYPDDMPEPTCDHQLFQLAGNFSMPPSPFHDSRVRSCTWHIYKPYTRSYIHLLIDSLDLLAGETIKVYDGRSNLAPRLALVRSGSHLRLPLSVRSSGSRMLVQFTTPQNRNYSASRWVVFSAKYHFEDKCRRAGELQCGSQDYKCYRPAQRCDGIWDCPLSGADEEKCYGCPEHSFNCGHFDNGRGIKCYFKHDRCSGASVCPNDADELNCNEQLCSQSRNLFLCANKRCILRNYMCDETDDCGDYSDEESCSLGNSRKVIVVAVVGSLLCSLLLVLSLGCACKFYYLRHNLPHRHHHHHHRGPRYDTPLSRLQAEMFRRRAPPPPYHEAMLTSRPYDEAVREYLAQTQTQQSGEPEASEQEAGGGSVENSGNDNGDPSVQNLISLMDFSEQDEEQLHNFNSRLEIHIPSDSSSDSDSEEEDSHGHSAAAANLAEDDSGHIEMTENLARASGANPRADAREGSLDVSEDSASATLSTDGTEMTSLGEEVGGDSHTGKEESPTCRQVEEESDKENNSDADSVCILCLDEEGDPASLDDGSDTRCLLQDV
ncbi:hypothetical protein ACOMHN_033802 [Nucella lapillus]